MRRVGGSFCLRNNCENRENSFRQFLYEGRDLLSVRLLLAVNEGGERERGKKKEKKRESDAGGPQGLGKSPTNGINQIRTLRCAKTSKTAAFNRRGVRRAFIQPKREYKSVTNVLQYSQTARELFFFLFSLFFLFLQFARKESGKINGPTYE